MSAIAESGAKAVRVTADGVISALPCRLLGAVAVGGTVTLYDDASAATAGRQVTHDIGTSLVWFGTEGVACSRGVYADITSASSVIVYVAARSSNSQ